MQLTFKSVLLAVALAYGSTSVLALPAGEVSLAERSEYEDLAARKWSDLFNFGSKPNGAAAQPALPASQPHEPHGGVVPAPPAPQPNGGAVSASSAVSTNEKPKTEVASSKRSRRKKGPYNPKPTMHVEDRRKFRKTATKADLKAAYKNRNHPFHSTAVNMHREAAVRHNNGLMQAALNDRNHPHHRAAQTVKKQQNRQISADIAKKNQDASNNKAAMEALPFGGGA